MSFRKITVLALLLSLFLTSCTTSADTKVSAEDVSEAEYEWVADFYELDYAVVPKSLAIYENSVYFAIADLNSSWHVSFASAVPEPTPDKSYNEYYRWELGAEEPEKLPISGHASVTHMYNLNLQPDNEGNLYIIFDNYLGKYDRDGNELFYSSFSDFLAPLNVSKKQFIDIYFSAVDADGNLYTLFKDNQASTNNMLCTIGADFTPRASVEIAGGFLMSDSRNTVYCTTSYMPTDVVTLNFDGSMGDKVLTNISPSFDSFCPYTEGKFITSSYDSVYVYDTADNSIAELFKWADVGIDANDVVEFRGLGNGTIVALLDEDNLSSHISFGNTLVFISLQEVSEKTTITLGTLITDSKLLFNVAEFNRENTEYKIVVKEYYDRVTDTTINHSGYQEALTKFHLDIAAGDCPDILCLDYEYLENYAEKGLFEDLTPYIEASPLTLPENIVDSYSFNGALVATPILLEIDTIVIPSDIVNGKTSWTLDEMMDFIAENNNSINGVSILNARQDYLLKYCLKMNLSRFVDLENYTCDFENDEFYSLLEFCHKYGTETKYTTPDLWVNMFYNDAVAYEISVCRPSEHILISQFLETEDVSYIGYPNDFGNGSILNEDYGSLAIFSGSENKEVAWKLIEFMLTLVPDYDGEMAFTGFPVASETLEQYVENETEEVLYYSEGKPVYSWSYVYPRTGKSEVRNHPPSEEEFAPIKELLLNAVTAKDYNNTIAEIIYENAQEYFDGEYTAEEVAKQIQSRVMLYLGEIK